MDFVFTYDVWMVGLHKSLSGLSEIFLFPLTAIFQSVNFTAS